MSEQIVTRHVVEDIIHAIDVTRAYETTSRDGKDISEMELLGHFVLLWIWESTRYA